MLLTILTLAYAFDWSAFAAQVFALKFAYLWLPYISFNISLSLTRKLFRLKLSIALQKLTADITMAISNHWRGYFLLLGIFNKTSIGLYSLCYCFNEKLVKTD